jgi:hypothetical protein
MANREAAKQRRTAGIFDILSTCVTMRDVGDQVDLTHPSARKALGSMGTRGGRNTHSLTHSLGHFSQACRPPHTIHARWSARKEARMGEASMGTRMSIRRIHSARREYPAASLVHTYIHTYIVHIHLRSTCPRAHAPMCPFDPAFVDKQHNVREIPVETSIPVVDLCAWAIITKVGGGGDGGSVGSLG